jgi:hypothetical protein
VYVAQNVAASAEDLMNARKQLSWLQPRSPWSGVADATVKNKARIVDTRILVSFEREKPRELNNRGKEHELMELRTFPYTLGRCKRTSSISHRKNFYKESSPE